MNEENLTYAEATNRRFRREIARAGGRICAFAGGFCLFIGTVSLIGRHDKAAGIPDLFQYSAALFTVSWLLLRFASDLWPFGKRIFS